MISKYIVYIIYIYIHMYMYDLFQHFIVTTVDLFTVRLQIPQTEMKISLYSVAQVPHLTEHST